MSCLKVAHKLNERVNRVLQDRTITFYLQNVGGKAPTKTFLCLEFEDEQRFYGIFGGNIFGKTVA